MLPTLFILHLAVRASPIETCETANAACNYVEYRNTICKNYKTAVAQDAAEADLLNTAESELLTSELGAIFANNKYFKEVDFRLSSIEPNNPADIVTELLSGTSDKGYYWEYTVKTTEAIMNICGSLTLTMTERFREPVKTVDEWASLIEDEIAQLVSTTASARVRLYDPNAVTDNCPTGWEMGIDATITDDCYPSNVDVTCFPNQMLVSFPADAVFRDASRLYTSDVQLVAGFASSSCSISLSSDRFYLSGSYDDCGFQVTHENDELVFSHSISGIHSTDLATDGIYASEVLSFPVTCRYADSSSISNVALVGYNPFSGALDQQHAAFAFELDAYTDAARQAPVTLANKVDLGKRIHNSIRPTAPLSSLIDYHIVECAAFEGIVDNGNGGVSGSGMTYELIQNAFCTADLVDVSLESSSDFSFNSFTFTPMEETLVIICQVKLCLISETSCKATIESAVCPAKYSI